MKAVALALYKEPVVFLGVIQGAATALSAAEVITPWVPLLTLAAITPIQRFYVKPKRRQ